MKKILLFIIAISFVMGCSKNDDGAIEKVTLEIKLPTYSGIKISPVYLFYRNSETEKILNNDNYTFSFNKEAYVNVKENVTIKYNDKQEANSEGVVIFNNVPKDYVQFVVRFESPLNSFSQAQLLDLKTATKYDFSK